MESSHSLVQIVDNPGIDQIARPLSRAVRDARSDSHDAGRAYAWTGYALALGAAYLGGELVYRQGVRVADVEG